MMPHESTLPLMTGRGGIRRVRPAIAAVFLAGCAALLLCACIPIVLPPTLDSRSRGNLGQEVPPDIVAGKSSRIDVLLALGEPDGRGPGDAWFTYTSTRSWMIGGILIGGGSAGAMGGGQSATRLLVKFDEAGLVAEARVEDRKCPQGGLMIGNGNKDTDLDAHTKDCLDSAGTDIRSVRQQIDAQVDAIAPDHGDIVARYDRAVVVQHPYPGCEFPHSMYFHSGPVFVASHALIQPAGTNIGGKATGPTVLPLNEVAQVLPLQRHQLQNWIVLERKDHVCLFLRTFGKTTLEQTRQQILDLIRALPANPSPPK
jgi:hypothetical protein